MTLENEIKQTRPFSSKKEQALVNIIYTSNWLFMKQNRYLKKHDISIQQYNVLRILNGQNGKPITINEIIERMLDKMSNASRLVEKLFQKGYVHRQQKEKNRRACDVFITDQGKDFLKIINVEAKVMELELGLDNDAELDKLNNLLDEFRKSDS